MTSVWPDAPHGPSIISIAVSEQGENTDNASQKGGRGHSPFWIHCRVPRRAGFGYSKVIAREVSPATCSSIFPLKFARIREESGRSVIRKLPLHVDP